jgi:hypothetical protein
MGNDMKTGPLSEAELAERARLSGWPRRLYDAAPAFGYAAALLYAGAILATHFLLVEMNLFGMLFLLFAGILFGSLGITSGIECIATLGRRAHIRELCRRSGMLPIETYINEEKEESGIALSILAKVHAMPPGTHRFIRIRFWPGGPAEAEFAAALKPEIRWIDGTDPGELISQHRFRLGSDAAQKFEALAAELPFGRRESLNSAVVDGSSWTLAVLRHGGGGEYALECNLDGLSDEDAALPGVRLLREIAQLEEAAGDPSCYPAQVS